MKQLILIIILGWVINANAQPNTEVYLFDILSDENGNQLANPKNISNNPGYDNQPSFWSDGQSILYSRTVNGQTEIARYFIETGETKIITNTLQGSEYSPTPTPDSRISSIRLDTTGLQLLYIYDLKGKAEVLVPQLVIGYHAWINNTDIVAFVLGEPATLQIVDTNTDKALVLEDSIGRSLHKIPGSNSFSYVDKSKENWLIKSMEPRNGKTRILAQTLENAEDYCWTPTEEIIMGKDDTLWLTNGDGEWKVFSDLSQFGLNGISRVAVSPNGKRLVIVVNE